jgi:tetratricopeptide (TPR) repeat protein
MKASLITMAVLLAGLAASAQSNPAANQSASPNAPAQTQDTAKPAAQAQPSGSTKKLPEAKTQEEFKAYQDAVAKTNPDELAAAADAFAAKFPNSELREALYVRAMNLYQQSNNGEKVIAIGRKAIALNPTDPQPLIIVASVLAETTRDTDMDRQERLNEAAKDAQAAIDNIDTGLQVPPNVPPERVAQVKTSILSIGYETLGVVNINQKNYAAAEQSLLKAIEVGKGSADSTVYLRLSVAQDNQGKYPQALESANKALQLAQPGTVVESLAKQQQARLQKLIAAGSPSSPATQPATAPASARPSPTQPTNTSPPPTPH